MSALDDTQKQLSFPSSVTQFKNKKEKKNYSNNFLSIFTGEGT